jgi:Flp pilus assembly protein TadG
MTCAILSSVSQISRRLKQNQRNDCGNVAIMTAVTLLPLLAGVGLAIDGGRAFLVQSQLGSAVDVTALTGARLYTDPDRDTKAKEFFHTNFVVDHTEDTLNTVTLVATETESESGSGLVKAVEVTATSVVPTIFMRIFGIPTVTVTAVAKASRKDDFPLELVMALDNTGSMALDIGGTTSRLKALKVAANTLVNTLYNSRPDAAEDDKLQIGIVPYTAYVNVGRLLDPAFVTPKPGYTDLATTDPLSWKGCVDADQTNTAAGNDLTSPAWNTAYDTQDMEAGRPVKASLFPSFIVRFDNVLTACVSPQIDTRDEIDKEACNEGSCSLVKVPNPDKGKDYCPDKIYAPTGATKVVDYPFHSYNINGTEDVFKRTDLPAPGYTYRFDWINVKYIAPPATEKLALSYTSKLTDRTANSTATFKYRADTPTADNFTDASVDYIFNDKGPNSAASPNTYCPEPALELNKHSKTVVRNYIDNNLKAFFPDIGTFSNLGLLWSWRMLSPQEPFKGKPLNAGYRKAVILMTDGELFHPGGTDVISSDPNDIWPYLQDGIRTAYGFASEAKLVANPNSKRGDLINALSNRLRKTCQNMRNEGIIIYTVTFDPAMSAAAKDVYRNCATSAVNYFDAPDAASLQVAFASIGDSLADVRLVK